MDNSVDPPSNLPDTVRSDPEFNTAYNRCVARQTRAHIMRLDQPPSSLALVCSRILGYMLVCAPSDALSQSTYYHFVRLFKAAKGQTTESSVHISGPSFDTLKAGIAYAMNESPIDQRTAGARALVWDFRCVLTGIIDATAYHTYKGLAENVLAPKLPALDTKAAHIYPAFTDKAFLVKTGNSRKDIDGIIISKNVLTLAVHVHGAFDRLTRGLKKRPRYIGIHAACCKAAQLSGATGHTEKTLRGVGECGFWCPMDRPRKLCTVL
ncbi:hypothetical protein EDB19DRAFT_2027214 [Suillus lakei]|nr:hypothetical protein EDB19DRAFT_2027214 [Suillus lakei]